MSLNPKKEILSFAEENKEYSKTYNPSNKK
jgi:hypothetical protein